MTGQPGTGGQGQPSTADTGSTGTDLLAETMGTLARNLEVQDDLDVMLAAIVDAAVAVIPGAEDGSISVITARRRVTSTAATSGLPIQVDAIQEELQQGPCLDSIHEQHTVRVADLTTEDRWPLFTRRASTTGAASMLALQLYVEGDNLGALNLYSRIPDAFTDESEQIGLLFAAHAAIAYIGVRKEAQSAATLTHRDLIGQAKGILMERYEISGERAFLLLTRLSQNTNRKLHDVAAELAQTRAVAGTAELPPPRVT